MRVKTEPELSEVDSILAAAEEEVLRNGRAVSIAVVDDGGHLLAFRRLSGASKSSAQIAIDKARCSALTRRSASFFEGMVVAGRIGAASLAGGIPMASGLPAWFFSTAAKAAERRALLPIPTYKQESRHPYTR